MQKKIVIGPYEKVNQITGKKALGDLVVEVTDVAVADWKDQKHRLTGNSLSVPKTFHELIAQCSSTQSSSTQSSTNQVTLIHLISQQPFTLDLSPWKGIDPGRYVRIDYGWVRKGVRW